MRKAVLYAFSIKRTKFSTNECKRDSERTRNTLFVHFLKHVFGDAIIAKGGCYNKWVHDVADLTNVAK